MSIEVPDLGSFQDRYKILAKLGSGGMADVFLAFQNSGEDFKRLVVVKRINSPTLRQSNSRKMFLSEARNVAALNHPHIVKIFDLCRMSRDVGIVMEYVDGENLDYLCKAAKKRNISIPLAITCKLMIEACNAIHHAHCAKTPDGKELKLIHRDIGPHNLMIDNNGYLKVIDFGIAKSANDNNLTTPGAIKGKLSYLAPDLFKHADIDARADLYALGLVFFELLTLQRPFSFQSDTAIAKVMHSIINDSIPLVSSITPDLPKELDQIVSKATCKDREDRYQDCAGLAADIQEFAQNDCGLASSQDIQAWLQQHFADRVARRREFERCALKKATQPGPENLSEDETPISSNKTANISEIVPKPTSASVVYPATGSVVLPARRVNPYAFLTLVFVLMACGTILVHHLFYDGGTHTSELDEQVNQNGIADNLFIKTDPPNSIILIDGTVVGKTSQAGINLRVEPGLAHRILIRQDGYEDYLLDVVGESYGQRRIETTLSPTPKSPEPTLVAVTKKASKQQFRRRYKRRPKSPRSSNDDESKKPTLPANSIKLESNPQKQSNGQQKQETKTTSAESASTETKPDTEKPEELEPENNETIKKTEDQDVKIASLDTAQAQPRPGLEQNMATEETAAPVENKTTHQPEAKVSTLIGPAQPLFQSSKLIRKRRIAGDEPSYPRKALRREKQGEVVVKLTVNSDGSVKGCHFLKDNRMFHSAVLRKVKDWRFSPHLVNGRPVATYSVLKFVFRLKRS